MNKNRVTGIVLLVTSIIIFTVVCYASVQTYVSVPAPQRGGFWRHFSNLFMFLGNTLVGFYISYFFFYRGKLVDLREENFKACANYDKFIQDLQELENEHVNDVMMRHMHTLEAPELYLYDSVFLKFAELLSGCSKGERKRLVIELINKIKPSRHFTRQTPCSAAGCSGYLTLSMKKGQFYRVPCPKCGARYACHVTKNNKISCRPIPAGYKRLTFSNFEKDLPEYLTRIKASITKKDMTLIAKKIVWLVNANPKTTFTKTKKMLFGDKELWERLDDIDDARRFIDTLMKSKDFFKSSATGTFPGWNKPLNMKTDEYAAYIAYLKFVAYKMKEDRQVIVDRGIVKKTIRRLLPDGIITDEKINEATRDILLHIHSADHYPDWETDDP